MRAYIFIAVTFFLCGLCTVLNTILAPYLQQVLHLSYTSVTSIYISFYLAYFLLAPVSGYLFRKGNYLMGIRIALLLCTFGTYLIFMGGTYNSFPLVLGGLFVMACGISILQVNANPYVLHLGSSETSSSRLSFLQGFFALGTVVAPFVGSFFILSSLYHPVDGSLLDEILDILPIQKPYFTLSMTWGLIFLLSEIFPLPQVTGLTEKKETATQHPLKLGIVWLGMLVIALAVGVEVTLGNYIIPLLVDRSIMNLNIDMAGHLAMIYWLGFMIGRFSSSVFLKDVEPKVVLYYHAIGGIVLSLAACFATGIFAATAALATGLCVSILFPILFAIILQECPASQMQVSGYMMMANVGGGLVPLMQGLSADSLGVHLSFIIPALCFSVILLFSLRKPKLVKVTI
ncbi:MAG: L-fucose-proton symporter [Chlamydiae bacterium]|nr:L-fucose-proton symporter [Chlamydiota bacterium]